MNNYIKPELEVFEIAEEDVIMSSGVTLPTDSFDDGIMLPTDSIEEP